ncbi:MAG: hypothetical protein HRT68_12670 [Flavobacteriaceae bacterium]|nr:hypothetical protein [Flavobacteriaceae bacterium]
MNTILKTSQHPKDAITEDGQKLHIGDFFYVISKYPNGGLLKSTPLRMRYPNDWNVCNAKTYYKKENCFKACHEENQQKQYLY